VTFNITRCDIFKLASNAQKIAFGRGSAPDPARRAYDAPSNP